MPLIDADIEKEIITGLITDTRYIKEIQIVFRKDLLQIPFARTVSQWCFDYFRKYNKSPESDIQGIYNSYCDEKRADPTQIELIGKFLSGLSSRHEKQNNIKYSIDKAELYFRSRSIEVLKENLSGLLLNGKVEEAEKNIAIYKRPVRPQTIGVDIIKDNIASILFSEDDDLFMFPGDLGELVGQICREDYILIAAPMKRGKSWWMQEFGLRALVRGLNVAHYSLEMSEKKMLKRIYQYFLMEPKYPKTIKLYPYFDKKNNIQYKELEKAGLNIANINKKKKQIEHMISGNSFRLCCYPTGSINVQDIRTHLDNLEHYNHFIPDVIVVDYADIMAPEPGGSRDERHKLNETQKALRGLAQERRCVVITGTQTDRSTFKKNIEEDNISEDIRKLAHATHVIALNQSREDKKDNLMRIEMLVARDDEFHVEEDVTVLQCLALGKPCLDSRWTKKIEEF